MAEEDFEFGEVLPSWDLEVAPERWERVREEVIFKDLAEEILSKAGIWKRNGNAICCPFHGSDRTPSFTFYDTSNSAFCFGCPPPKQNQTYDSINFIAKYFDINKVKALEWVEKHYKFPPITSTRTEEEVDEEDEEEEYFTVDDLKPAYLSLAPTIIESAVDAQSLLKKYFLAIRSGDPLFLARVLGRRRLESIRVAGRANEGTRRST